MVESIKGSVEKGGKKSCLNELLVHPLVHSLICLDSMYGNSIDSKEKIIDELNSESKKIRENNLSSVENILANQMIVLQGVVSSLMLKSNRTQSVQQSTIYLDLALKAQNNLRKTAESLVNIKRPQNTTQNTTVIKNSAQNLNQQINIEKSFKSPDRVDIKNQTNELLTTTQTLDINAKVDERAEAKASNAN
jgi:hypothetical protein